MNKHIGSIFSQDNKQYGYITCIIEDVGYRWGLNTFKILWLSHPAHPNGGGRNEFNQYEFLKYFEEVE